MKRVLYIITLFSILCICISCENAIDKHNPVKQSAETQWSTLDGIQSGLTAAYCSLRDVKIYLVAEEGVRSDMWWPGKGRPATDGKTYGNWYRHDYNSTTDQIEEKWNSCYTAIWRANQVIEALENLSTINQSDERWSILMGHAKFIRGLMYFYLHSSYNNGSVVLRTKNIHHNSEFSQPLSSREDVRMQFVSDLEDAYARLPLLNDATDTFKELATKDAAATILGMSALYEKEYSDAVYWLDIVVENNQYALETDISKMFTTAGEHNAESIFEVNYNLEYHDELTNWDPLAMTNVLGTITMRNLTLSSWLYCAYLNEPIDRNNPINTEERRVRGDVSWRTTAMLGVVRDETTPFYISDNYGKNGTHGGIGVLSNGWGQSKKFTNSDIDFKEVMNKSGKNITLLRLSDVYLMLAESLINSEDSSTNIQKALDLINQIRSRWGLVLLGNDSGNLPLNYTATYNGELYTKESLMRQIMDVERPLELSLEGHQSRWQDLRRWGLLEADDNNIFKRRSEQVFYAKDYLYNDINGEPTKHTKYNVVSDDPADAPNEYDAKVVVDYEYDASLIGYSAKDDKYYPIPADEIMNNPAIK